MRQVRFRFLGRSGESIEQVRSAPGPIAYANGIDKSLMIYAQVVRLLLLLLVYWMVLIYPWGFRIYSRVVEGIIRVDSFRAQSPSRSMV
jgi:hypothetical protein